MVDESRGQVSLDNVLKGPRRPRFMGFDPPKLFCLNKRVKISDFQTLLHKRPVTIGVCETPSYEGVKRDRGLSKDTQKLQGTDQLQSEDGAKSTPVEGRYEQTGTQT